jgi:biopolymer transport protein ExbD
MRGSQPSRLRSEINITPLIDVCLVLLIVFMVVTPILNNGPTVQLPKTKDPKKADRDANSFPIVLVFDDPPQVLFGPEFRWVQPDELKRSVAALHASEPDRRIVLRADRRLSYGSVKAVMRTLSEAGFHDVGLAAEKDTQPSAPN